MPGSVSDFLFTDHALFQMERRGISEAVVRQVLEAPEQRETVRPGRDVLQTRVEDRGRTVLVRVFVDLDRRPAEVVTVYRTTKIDKYWR